MRKFLDGSGSDSTAAALAHLAANRELRFADLYVISTSPNYAGQSLAKTFLLTSHGAPLNWGHRGTFTPVNIERTGVQSKIGLEVDTLDITWAARDADVLLSGGSPATTLLTVMQGIETGCFTRGNVEVWRCIMPTEGDCNTLGACLMFAGRIGNISQDRLVPKMTVISRLEALNKMARRERDSQ